MTLIEVMIYIVLLSFLLVGFIQYAYTLYQQQLRLGNDIEDEYNRGFIALIAVVMLAMSTLAVSLVSLSSAASYADSVYRRELRIQANLNVSSCLDTGTLMVAKDFFIQGTTTVKEFGCTLFVTNDFAGHISLSAKVKYVEVGAEGVKMVNLPNQ